MQRLMYRARTGAKLGASAVPDKQDARPPPLRGRRWAHYWPMPPRTSNGKPLLPCGICFGICTVTRPLSLTGGVYVVARNYRAHCCKAWRGV